MRRLLVPLALSLFSVGVFGAQVPLRSYEINGPVAQDIFENGVLRSDVQRTQYNGWALVYYQSDSSKFDRNFLCDKRVVEVSDLSVTAWLRTDTVYGCNQVE